MHSTAERDIDCVVCGLITVDIVARSFPLHQPIGAGRLHWADRIELTTGGLVSNSGMALSRLGLRTAAIGYVGHDTWADFVRRRYQEERIDTTGLCAHISGRTCATIVLVGQDGERSFLFESGASQYVDVDFLRQHEGLLRRARVFLFGYYGLHEAWDRQLPAILSTARACGCQTALDAIVGPAGMEQLEPILPLLDIYVPSWQEAQSQTGHSDPRIILAAYRRYAPRCLLGVKLGARGAVLSPRVDEYVEIPPVPPPGDVVDTTGAGDAFYAGLVAGLVRGRSAAEAGRIAAAAGACSVTALGASAGIRDFHTTLRIAGMMEDME